MFLGQYEYKVDAKGRLPIPPKFRQEFREGLVLSRGPETCIEVRRNADFQKLADSLASQAVTHSRMRMLNRSIFGSANDLLLDGQGRISLPASLRQYAQIEDIAAIVGVNDHIELWNPVLWNKERESSEGQMLEIMESLEAES